MAAARCLDAASAACFMLVRAPERGVWLVRPALSRQLLSVAVKDRTCAKLGESRERAP